MGEPKIDQKMTFCLALTIEGMDLKLMMLYYLFRQVSFNSEGVKIFFVLI